MAISPYGTSPPPPGGNDGRNRFTDNQKSSVLVIIVCLFAAVLAFCGFLFGGGCLFTISNNRISSSTTVISYSANATTFSSTGKNLCLSAGEYGLAMGLGAVFSTLLLSICYLIRRRRRDRERHEYVLFNNLNVDEGLDNGEPIIIESNDTSVSMCWECVVSFPEKMHRVVGSIFALLSFGYGVGATYFGIRCLSSIILGIGHNYSHGTLSQREEHCEMISLLDIVAAIACLGVIGVILAISRSQSDQLSPHPRITEVATSINEGDDDCPLIGCSDSDNDMPPLED